MGYQTGTSTGPNDLLDKLRLFLIGEGWTVNGWTTVGLGYRLHVQKTVSGGGPEMYFNFRSAIDERGTTITEDNYNSEGYGDVTGIVVNGSTGYSAGNSWDKQPGYPQNITVNPYTYSFGCVMSPMSISAIPAYYFFTVGNSVHICVEVTAGKFQFMSFGCLNKQGTYTGGQYFTASFESREPYRKWNGIAADAGKTPQYFTVNVIYNSPHGAVYLEVDSVADWRCADLATLGEIFFPCVAGQSAGTSDTKGGVASQFFGASPNFYNNIAAMTPIYVFGKRSDNNYSLLGWPDGVRFLNVTNYSVGQELTYGSETWKVFHADSGNFTPLNMYCGFAFLKEL